MVWVNAQTHTRVPKEFVRIIDKEASRGNKDTQKLIRRIRGVSRDFQGWVSSPSRHLTNVFNLVRNKSTVVSLYSLPAASKNLLMSSLVADRGSTPVNLHQASTAWAYVSLAWMDDLFSMNMALEFMAVCSGSLEMSASTFLAFLTIRPTRVYAAP